MNWHRSLSSKIMPRPTGKKDRFTRRVRLHLEELETRALLSASSVTAAALTTPLSDVTAQTNATTVAPAASSSFSGYTPAQLEAAYNVPKPVTGQTLPGAGETIAIVDAYNDPNIASDLATFDATYFSTLPAANLKVVDQNGNVINPKSTSVTSNASWGVEESLDVEWAHAIAPGANIVLVEANSSSLSDLMTAVQTASKMANVVSMSWGSGEFNGETSYDQQYFSAGSVTKGPGVAYVASAGDSSAYVGPEWPASSPDVLAVGGTTLTQNSSSTRGYSETAWSASYSWYSGYEGGGGGISSYEAAPSFQSQNGISASGRTTPDVAWDANPSTGVSVYDSYGEPGWGYVGGTSAGAPAWAGIAAIADQSSGQSLSTTEVENALYGVYNSSGGANYKSGSAYTNDFNDITSGSNGYSASKGYDLATGLGSPKVSTLISSLFPDPPSGSSAATSSTTTSTTSSTPSSTTGGTTTPPSHQRTWDGPAHHDVIPVGNEAASAPTVTSGSSMVVLVANASSSTSASTSSSSSISTVNNVSPFPLSVAASSLSVTGNTPLFAGSLNASVPQSALVFGASGWNGSASSLRLSSLGLSGQVIDQLAANPADGEEDGNDSSAENGLSTDGNLVETDMFLFDSAPPPLFEGEVGDGSDGGDGSGGEGSSGGE